MNIQDSIAVITQIRTRKSVITEHVESLAQLSLLPLSAESGEPQPRFGFCFSWEHELQVGLFLLPEESLLSLGGGDKGIKCGEEVTDAVLLGQRRQWYLPTRKERKPQ